MAASDRVGCMVIPALGGYGRNSPPPAAGAGAGAAVALEPVPLGANSLIEVELAGAAAGRARVAEAVSCPTRPVTWSYSGCGARRAKRGVRIFGRGVRVATGRGVRVAVA